MAQPPVELAIISTSSHNGTSNSASMSLIDHGTEDDEPEDEGPEDEEGQKISSSLVWAYIAINPGLPFAFSAGLIMVSTAIGFTFWLNKQTFSCPEWANGCYDHESVAWIRNNITQVQSVVATVYTLGLSALAETAKWPLNNAIILHIARVEHTSLRMSRLPAIHSPRDMLRVHVEDGACPWYSASHGCRQSHVFSPCWARLK